MSLQQQLNAVKEKVSEQAPAPAIKAFDQSIQELVESGLKERALKVGEKAPDALLTDAEGNEVKLNNLLAKGPVVISFYRGVWCPYCNVELQALEASHDEIKAKGATLIAISMQRGADSRKSQRDNNLSFPILTDKAGELVEKFGIRWRVPDYLIEFKQMFGMDLPKIHDDGEWNLPMPARYIIDSDGTIAYAEINPDYTQRPEPSDLFPVLDELANHY